MKLDAAPALNAGAKSQPRIRKSYASGAAYTQEGAADLLIC